jgi:prephenate dehydratase
MKKITYLGPKNTYTEQAAKMLAQKIGEKTELREQVSLEAVAKSVASGEADMGVMAYYNYLRGLVQECLDLIYENNLKIIKMQRLPIILSIGAHRENTCESEVYSHPKALAQSSQWLWNNYKECRQIPMTSTAAAAQKVAELRSGLAIASTAALKSNRLKLIAENIGNKKNGRTNFTDFYLVARENENKYNDAKKYLTMVAITPHADKPGLLAEILQQVAYYGLNNAKIHSRPALDDVAIDDFEPQMFYLEIMGHQSSDNLKRCIDSLKYKLTRRDTVRVLGSYERPEI